jgi:transcriptional regulator with XRE-family HTH domain
MASMDVRILVGKNVARLREARALKQEPFSDLSGFSQSYLSQIENGKINLTLLSLHELAEALQVPIVELFRMHDDDR